MKANTKKQLERAIESWADAAMKGACNPDYAAMCDATVKSLQMEMETGIPHCSCHFKPWEDCPSRINR